MLEIDDLIVRYGATPAVDGLSLAAQAGAVTAILGPNGAGKTTTVEVACGLRRPDGGSVRLLGHSPSDPAIRARVGVMLQTGGLYPSARPLEWLTYLARLYPNPADPATLLETVGIDPGTRTSARRMSGGEQQRVKLAAALLPRPDVLFLDEPTAGLDPAARRSLLDLLAEGAAAGVGIILTTHLLADVEELADQVTVIQHGRVVADGTVAELTGGHDALRFTGPLHLDVASLAGALPGGYQVEEPRPGAYVVHGAPNPQVLAAVTAWCAQHGVMPTGLSVGTQTLEELLLDISNTDIADAEHGERAS